MKPATAETAGTALKGPNFSIDVKFRHRARLRTHCFNRCKADVREIFASRKAGIKWADKRIGSSP
jgi:hypothetical protein